MTSGLKFSWPKAYHYAARTRIGVFPTDIHCINHRSHELAHRMDIERLKNCPRYRVWICLAGQVLAKGSFAFTMSEGLRVRKCLNGRNGHRSPQLCRFRARLLASLCLPSYALLPLAAFALPLLEVSK